jgi:SAM-dependent methyltransferase
MPDSDAFLARHYNKMTGYPGRIDAFGKLIEPWVRQWRVQTALDAGCGGGALLFALRRLGVEPVGLDLSEPMLRLAMDNARQLGESFRFAGAPFSSAGAIFPAQFDACFLLGNALAGHETESDVVASLRGLHESLKPGGHILIQNLNPEPFFLGLKDLINRRSEGEVSYLRFAVPIDGERLMFHAIAETAAQPPEIATGIWFRWNRPRMTACLDEAGFREIEAYGGIDRSPYDERRSTDLVFAATKPHK